LPAFKKEEVGSPQNVGKSLAKGSAVAKGGGSNLLEKGGWGTVWPGKVCDAKEKVRTVGGEGKVGPWLCLRGDAREKKEKGLHSGWSGTTGVRRVKKKKKTLWGRGRKKKKNNRGRRISRNWWGREKQQRTTPGEERRGRKKRHQQGTIKSGNPKTLTRGKKKSGLAKDPYSLDGHPGPQSAGERGRNHPNRISYKKGIKSETAKQKTMGGRGPQPYWRRGQPPKSKRSRKKTVQGECDGNSAREEYSSAEIEKKEKGKGPSREKKSIFNVRPSLPELRSGNGNTTRTGEKRGSPTL